jgi:hypothetical protein
LFMVQPFGHIPADMFIRLQFHIRVALHEINLSRRQAFFNISDFVLVKKP